MSKPVAIPRDTLIFWMVACKLPCDTCEEALRGKAEHELRMDLLGALQDMFMYPNGESCYETAEIKHGFVWSTEVIQFTTTDILVARQWLVKNEKRLILSKIPKRFLEVVFARSSTQAAVGLTNLLNVNKLTLLKKFSETFFAVNPFHNAPQPGDTEMTQIAGTITGRTQVNVNCVTEVARNSTATIEQMALYAAQKEGGEITTIVAELHDVCRLMRAPKGMFKVGDYAIVSNDIKYQDSTVRKCWGVAKVMEVHQEFDLLRAERQGDVEWIAGFFSPELYEKQLQKEAELKAMMQQARRMQEIKQMQSALLEQFTDPAAKERFTAAVAQAGGKTAWHEGENAL